MATFSVVALVKEAPDVIRRFAAFYQRIGAERIFIFHDGPIGHLVEAGLDPTALAAEGVELIACDAAFWERELGSVPDNIQTRLRGAYVLGQRRCTSDWLFICDADEFIFARQPVGTVLDAIPGDVDSVVLSVAEAVWGPDEDIGAPFGSTWFRRPGPSGMAGQLADLRVYGPIGLMFRRGILSHIGGKQFIRTAAQFDQVTQHRAMRGGHTVTIPFRQAHTQQPDALELAHFDAVSYERWREKFRRRLTDSAAAMRERSFRRRWQIHLFRWISALRPQALPALFRGYYMLSPRQIALLERKGLAVQDDIFATAAPASAQRA